MYLSKHKYNFLFLTKNIKIFKIFSLANKREKIEDDFDNIWIDVYPSVFIKMYQYILRTFFSI